MKVSVALLCLLLAACLEVGGDAVVRAGLKTQTGSARLLTIGLGGVVLLAYGVFVNVAPADFGRLLGIYVAFFFVVAQLVNLFAFSSARSSSRSGRGSARAGSALYTKLICEPPNSIAPARFTLLWVRSECNERAAPAAGRTGARACR